MCAVHTDFVVNPDNSTLVEKILQTISKIWILFVSRRLRCVCYVPQPVLSKPKKKTSHCIVSSCTTAARIIPEVKAVHGSVRSTMFCRHVVVVTLTLLAVARGQTAPSPSWVRYAYDAVNVAVVSRVSVDPYNATCAHADDCARHADICQCECERRFDNTFSQHSNSSVPQLRNSGHEIWAPGCSAPEQAARRRRKRQSLTSQDCFIHPEYTGPWFERETHLVTIKPSDTTSHNG